MEETVGGGELPAWARRGLVPESMAQKRLIGPAEHRSRRRPFMTSADTVNRSVSTVSIVRQRTCHRRSYGPGRPKLSLFSLSPGQPTQLTVLTVVFEGNWGPDGRPLSPDGQTSWRRARMPMRICCRVSAAHGGSSPGQPATVRVRL